MDEIDIARQQFMEYRDQLRGATLDHLAEMEERRIESYHFDREER
jgi:hypothetical protein